MGAARGVIPAVVLLSIVHVVTSCTPTTVTCSGDCCYASGASYTASSSSQGYIDLNDYGDYWACVYTITAPAGASLSIGHTRMNVDRSTVWIINEQNTVLFKTSWNQIGSTYLPGRVATVEFSAPSAKVGGGFTTLWSVNVVCLVSCPSGQTDCDGTYGGSTCCNCDAGKYKTTPGNMTCTHCDAGKYSTAQGASAAGTCLNCEGGKYSATVGATGVSTCTNCGAGKYSSTMGGASTCINCLAGQYSATVPAVNSTSCLSCPGNSGSAAGSTAVTSCLCNVGYTGANGGMCAACDAGKYKTAAGSAGCTSCAAGKYLSSTGATAAGACVPCPVNAQPATASAATSCLCNAGFLLQAGVCGACPKGTYKATADNVACTNCRANTYSLATGATTIDTCQPCSPNSQSVVGSSSPTSCVCNLGFTGADGGTCNLCAKGTFKSTTGSSDCLACARGTFGDSLGASACTSCAAGKYSQAQGAVSQAECSTTLRVLNGSEASAAVRVEADTCALACQPPFVLLRERLRALGLWGRADVAAGAVVLETSELPSALWGLDAERTCVRCAEDACGVGRYPAGVLCQCMECDMDEELDALPAIM